MSPRGFLDEDVIALDQHVERRDDVTLTGTAGKRSGSGFWFTDAVRRKPVFVPFSVLRSAEYDENRKGCDTIVVPEWFAKKRGVDMTDQRAAWPATTVAATSEGRTVNNVMRHQYRVLTEVEKAQMQHIKDLGLMLVQQLHAIGGTDPLGSKQASRELSLAQTKAEEAVMWAVKHITA